MLGMKTRKSSLMPLQAPEGNSSVSGFFDPLKHDRYGFALGNDFCFVQVLQQSPENSAPQAEDACYLQGLDRHTWRDGGGQPDQ